MTLADLRHKVDPVWLQSMVTSMKYFNRWFPGLARKVVGYVADNEVIACGLMPAKGNQPIIIYSPEFQKQHKFFSLNKKQQIERKMSKVEVYLGELVKAQVAQDAKEGEVYLVNAKRHSDDREVQSPKIHMKMKTDYSADLLKIMREGSDSIIFDWSKGLADYEGMIFFLGIENEQGEGMIGLYTRERKISYPDFKGAVLRIGTEHQIYKLGENYRAKLLVVDYHGWVPVVGETSFEF